MKIVTVIGTRPEIIKMSSLLPIFDKQFEHTLVHADQHYDYDMDAVMFEQLKLRKPDFRLNTNKKSQAVQVGEMVAQISEILAKIRPDFVAVHGDTNSTLAAAIAANKSGIKLAHIEAGCRCFDYSVPEEYNRIVVDHLSDLLFAPDHVAADNLRRENVANNKIKSSGSTVFDCVQRNKELANKNILESLGLKNNAFVVSTLHRPNNVDDPVILSELLSALNIIGEKIPVVLSVHPRTQKNMLLHNIKPGKNITTTKPLGYLEFLALLQACRFIVSDAGGIQEEAVALNKPCLILRNVTEWSRLTDAGKNFIATTKPENIVGLAERLLDDAELKRIQDIDYKSDSGASEKIVNILKEFTEN